MNIVLGLLVLCTAFFSQNITPVLKVEADNTASEMVLEELTVGVEILGLISETRLTMTFYNPHNRVMEGELTFPLPQGATVTGYALDVDGLLVDGVAVEKEKARQVFETEVRRGIDPGIIEQIAGNHFRTRVYPLPPKGRRIIMVRYLSELEFRGESACFRLPLSLPYAVKKFSFRADVLGDKITPKLAQSSMKTVQFVNWHHSFRAEASVENFILKGDFIIELPDFGRQKVFVQKTAKGQSYFYAWDRPVQPKVLVGAKKIRQITLFWDVSGSRAEMDHEAEYEFLRTWFLAQKGIITVHLVLLRHRLFDAQMLTVGADAEELIKRLKTVYYDGGTNLSALAEFTSKADLAFLFSDGLGNFEPVKGHYKVAPLYTIALSNESDFSSLSWISAQSGGELIHLGKESAQEAVARIGRPAFKYLGLTRESNGISQVYPSISKTVSDHLIICGQLSAETGHLGITYGSKGIRGQQTDLDVLGESVPEGNLLESFWALKKIEELMLQQEKNSSELLETGKRYGLVTPETSLIVLERLDQYIKYHIMPPESRPQMRDQYKRQLEMVENRRKEREKSKIDQVMAMWRERLAWFNTDFSQLPKPKPEQRKGERTLETAEEAVAPQALGDVRVGTAPPSPAMASSVADREALPEEAVSNGKMKKDIRDREGRIVKVDIKPFDPQTPYLESLKGAAKEDLLSVYLSQRKQYGSSPSFFVDCADFFYGREKKSLALQILSNLAEMRLEDTALLRILAGRLALQKELNLARIFYERVLKLRPEEPQSCRDLALVLADQKEYRRAVSLLNQVVFKDWDRFNGIEIIALMEINNIIRRANSEKVKDLPVSPAFIQLMDIDLRLVLTWDADATDIDLHVVEPTGEEVYYSHKLSSSGGLVSNDFTQGYGPEEFVVRKAVNGNYKIKVKYYGSSSQRLLGPVTVMVDIFTHFGRPSQQKRTVLLRLEEAKEMVEVATVDISAKK